MPLRLWQRLFLVLALLSAGALACFVAWQQLSFRRSFRDYLDRVALQHLQEGAARLAGGVDEMHGEPSVYFCTRYSGQHIT